MFKELAEEEIDSCHKDLIKWQADNLEDKDVSDLTEEAKKHSSVRFTAQKKLRRMFLASRRNEEEEKEYADAASNTSRDNMAASSIAHGCNLRSQANLGFTSGKMAAQAPRHATVAMSAAASDSPVVSDDSDIEASILYEAGDKPVEDLPDEGEAKPKKKKPVLPKKEFPLEKSEQ